MRSHLPLPASAASQAALILALALLTAPVAQADTALPTPLSLESALSLASAAHPERALARSALARAQAETRRAHAADGARLDARLDARYINPPPASPYPEHNDSSAALVLNQPLYDFGRSRARDRAAEAGLEAARHAQKETLARQRLEIMRRFFDVLLADQRFAEANEAMAVAYVDFDRARDRNKLGQISDIELLAREDAYQAARSRRYADEAAQRTSRALLAAAMGRPDTLPEQLIPPHLAGIDRQPPDYEALLARALRDNPALAALRARLARAQSRLAERQAEGNPRLGLELRATRYARDFGTRDPFSAGLVLEVPLYSGGRVDADSDLARAEVSRARAEASRYEYRLRQAILETWQRLLTLKARAEALAVQTDYRDLYLDRSRALYDLQLKTDLGDAMVQQSATRSRLMANRFERALAWETLATLTGDTHLEPIGQPEHKP
ncbi:TolC family protein [Acidihalobacter prosperus]|uniref:Transporter n=1 Tax=Acidihalobacter prosperus TaxID=160660 RepID=A0A1A6C501_9GAMM|nr:TolC family protein [Acidihalobacter prosperus]OBS09638.1 hypothetical protein Thpro_021966 [Acidihalobacter prosperus]